MDTMSSSGITGCGTDQSCVGGMGVGTTVYSCSLSAT